MVVLKSGGNGYSKCVRFAFRFEDVVRITESALDFSNNSVFFLESFVSSTTPHCGSSQLERSSMNFLTKTTNVDV